MIELIAVAAALCDNEGSSNKRLKPSNNINIRIESDREEMKKENLTYHELMQSRADFWAKQSSCPEGWDKIEHHL